METPPVSKKVLGASLTKSSLTPCRRPGLSRHSSRSLHKSGHTVTNIGVQRGIVVNDSKSSELVENTPKLNCDEVPLKLSDAQNKHCVTDTVRRRLNVVSKISGKTEGENKDFLKNASVEDDSKNCKKIKLSIEKVNSCEEGRNSSSSLSHEIDSIPTVTMNEDNDSGEDATPQVIEKLVRSIQEKKKKLEQLKVQKTYAKKHNLEELRAETAKWKRAGREALEYALSLATQAGHSVTTKQLMSQHGFPTHLMGYNSEDDEFHPT